MPATRRRRRRTPSLVEYRALAEFRYQIRRFLRFSERAARAAGLGPQHHQLLLAVKGLPAGRRPTVGEIAERLQLQHHSAVELIDRLAAHGLVRRDRDPRDHRQVVVRLTARGEAVLHELSLHHLAELQAMSQALGRTPGMPFARMVQALDRPPPPARTRRRT
ncbi:MAG TPA: helix-turn-helix domain-containing protein [Candidatus Binatia bacterium]|nr:helix-turn-helix domain-containing protein [Candidatus Binatia bacterium]